MKKRITIIGSGLAGMACAAYLAKEGHEVQVIEKNRTYGGRLQTYEENGFVFDSGPSWYWMPDVFERFFNDFGKTRSDFYTIKKLDPGYRVVFDKKNQIQIGDDLDKIAFEFEKIEKGSGKKLKNFIKKAKNKINWSPKITFKKGIKSTIKFYNEQANK